MDTAATCNKMSVKIWGQLEKVTGSMDLGIVRLVKSKNISLSSDGIFIQVPLLKNMFFFLLLHLDI